MLLFLRAFCVPSDLIYFLFCLPIIFSDEYKLRFFLSWNFLHRFFFLSLTSKYFPQPLLLAHFQTLLLKMKRQASHSYKTSKVFLVSILICAFVWKEDKLFWTEHKISTTLKTSKGLKLQLKICRLSFST